MPHRCRVVTVRIVDRTPVTGDTGTLDLFAYG